MYLLSLLPVLVAAGASSAPCSTFTVTNSSDYWGSIAGCAPCLASGCGFSLSSLVCLDLSGSHATDDTTLSGLPSLCPSLPTCSEYLSCGDCLAHSPDCAWCGRESTCLLSTAAHSGETPCTAVQYQAPCKSPQDRAYPRGASWRGELGCGGPAGTHPHSPLSLSLSHAHTHTRTPTTPCLPPLPSTPPPSGLWQRSPT